MLLGLTRHRCDVGRLLLQSVQNGQQSEKVDDQLNVCLW